MKNKILNPLIYLLALAVFLSAFSSFAYASENTTELSVISANISGIPAFLTKYDRDVPKAQKTLGKMLNESGYDIICVQEDFYYHDEFSGEMTNYQYTTLSIDNMPFNDGLNIFSKYPIYNVERVTWKKHNGVFFDGADEFSSKGFIKCTVDVNGILIDLYNLHCDAYRTEADQYTKKAQLIQLADYFNIKSKDRPIIITGDTNLTFHNDPLADMYDILIVENGFTDTWVEIKNNGNYFQGENAQALIDAWYDKFGGHDWGRWDSVERVLYKNGDGLKIKPTMFEYKIYTDNKDFIKSLTDHRIMECKLKIDASEYEKPEDLILEKEKEPPFFKALFRSIGVILRFIFILLKGIMQLIFSNVYSAIIFIAIVLLILYRRIKKILQKKRR